MIPGVLVALHRVPGAREAVIGELVIGDEASALTEALLWLMELPDGPERRHWIARVTA